MELSIVIDIRNSIVQVFGKRAKNVPFKYLTLYSKSAYTNKNKLFRSR
jgi:hypothetical protein